MILFKIRDSLFNSKPWLAIKDNGLKIIQVSFALLCIVLVWWFFKHEQKELSQVPQMLRQTNPYWLWFGIVLSIVYIFLQAIMYQMAFKATGSNTRIFDATVLFLKRNLASVFLPAGGVSSLAFFGQTLEKKGVSKSSIHLASALYGFAGIASIILVAIPAFISAFFYVSIGWTSWLALAITLLLTIGILLGYRSIQRGGALKVWLDHKIPVLRNILDNASTSQLERKYILLTIFYSVLIEVCGIAHLYIAMEALGVTPVFLGAVIGYVVAVIFILISPFLRGVGAVELSMAFLLAKFGYDQSTALSITMLFRIFEFWAPLLAGVIAFILPWNKIVLRIVPSALLMLSGIVNILSVLTPAIAERIVFVHHFISIDVSHASNFLVFATGIFMLGTGLFLLRAQRSAWILACLLSLVSVAGNLLKAYDYEEASLSLIVLLILLVTRKQYFVKGAISWHTRENFLTLGICFVMILIYGILGFYFIDDIHFQRSFTVYESVFFTVREFLLVDNDMEYIDSASLMFFRSINLLGFTFFSFVFYTVFKSWLSNTKWARSHLLDDAFVFTQKYGSSSLDYFKHYWDKQLFWSVNQKAYISFKVSGSFAVVLEKPVAVDIKESKQCMLEFEDYCNGLGYSTLYYRVGKQDLELFSNMDRKQFYLGQEAIVDLHDFSLGGKDKKSLRNAVNKLKSSGYMVNVYSSPLAADLLDRLEEVSASWPHDNGKSEMLFAEGMFVRHEIAGHDVVVLERDGEVFAFLNIIPDYAYNEGTYDLIRKKNTAPNGAMDGLILEMFRYFKEKDIRYVNLGLAPMSGLDKASGLGEHVIKFVYEHAARYGHYKGLREFKDKYDPQWQRVYLMYSDDLQLFGIPKALRNVMKD